MPLRMSEGAGPLPSAIAQRVADGPRRRRRRPRSSCRRRRRRPRRHCGWGRAGGAGGQRHFGGQGEVVGCYMIRDVGVCAVRPWNPMFERLLQNNVPEFEPLGPKMRFAKQHTPGTCAATSTLATAATTVAMATATMAATAARRRRRGRRRRRRRRQRWRLCRR